MQQTVAVAAETKDLTDVDADLETTLVSGLSYFFYAVVVTVLVPAAVDVAMTVAFGLSSCCSAVVALAVPEADVDATTTAATRINPCKKLLPQWQKLFHISLTSVIYFLNVSFLEAI